MNRAAFFEALRKAGSGVFGNNRLTQGQVDGLEVIVGEGLYRETPLRWLAYMLATAYHETARTMQPIREFGRGRGKKYGKPVPHHGNQVAYGRGYVQLTWDWNYQRADRELNMGGRLVRDYDLALKESVAASIMFAGMEHGWFTNGRHKLADHLPGPIVTRKDYRNARRIINGTDDADLIAGYACAFDAALVAADYPH